MKTFEVRQKFLDYFKRHDHTVVPSSSLVPANDPSLLFTNAGMVQFKNVFLGAEKRPYMRAVSSQRCVRAGGKHNDLENVGYTARHHTFFEMLGNFSFGDYFKRDAIRYAWDFLTNDLNLPADRLWVTVYTDDDEAAGIWLDEIKVDPKRFGRLGEESNFWQMGETGPCGPCSEIFYDHGPEIAGGPPGSADEDGDRYVEIWNLVFMQYNRDGQGRLTPLPKPSVDTGMGLERTAAVLQHVASNYDTDLFRNLIAAAADVLSIKPKKNPSLNVIVDHIRASAFLLTDGVLPSNEGRGYVLRRLIRRAVRHGHNLGARDAFFHKLVGPLVREMGDAYPELKKVQTEVASALKQEEERFAETLEQGLRILDEALSESTSRSKKLKTIPGDLIFKLYDTYGFPVDLTRDVAMERGLTLDMAGYDRAMEVQRKRAQAASSFKTADLGMVNVTQSTEFLGYEGLRGEGTVLQLMRASDASPVDRLRPDEQGNVVLDRTPFYAESGGQVGDRGLLRKAEGGIFRVTDTQKIGQIFVHTGILESSELCVGDAVTAEVTESSRRATMLNHSATHLMHKALRDVLGPHVQQKGSLVDEKRTRFDFSHSAPLTPDQITEVERRVNAQVLRNEDTRVRVMNMKQALAEGAMALFGEKYGDEVRVMNIGDSIELCGGTHVSRTGDIGLFKIISESGVAAGVRRVEAITGEAAIDYVHETESRLQNISNLVRASPEDAAQKIEQLQARAKTLERELEQLRSKLASGEGADLSSQAQQVKGIKVIAARLDGADAKGLREAVDRLKNKLAPAAVVLASVSDNKVTLVAGVTKDLVERIHAGELINEVAIKVGGKGGGRADMAQAGGNDPSRLEAALSAVPAWVAQRV
jgi:alanyl-tRNA synthetase